MNTLNSVYNIRNSQTRNDYCRLLEYFYTHGKTKYTFEEVLPFVDFENSLNNFTNYVLVENGFVDRVSKIGKSWIYEIKDIDEIAKMISDKIPISPKLSDAFFAEWQKVDSKEDKIEKPVEQKQKELPFKEKPVKTPKPKEDIKTNSKMINAHTKYIKTFTEEILKITEKEKLSIADPEIMEMCSQKILESIRKLKTLINH